MNYWVPWVLGFFGGAVLVSLPHRKPLPRTASPAARL